MGLIRRELSEGPPMEGKRHSVFEIAEVLGVSKTAIYNWFEEGLRYEIKHIIGRKPFKVTTVKEIERFMSYKYRGE